MTSKRKAATARGARVAILLCLAAGALFGGCSTKVESGAASEAAASSITLKPAQRANIKLFTVKTSEFHRTVEATGAVDFDNDQSTSVLAPFSGPVARVIVSLGAHLNKGDALATVDSPDFATAVSDYRKALSTARTLRRLADVDKDLLEHHGVAQKEADQAETDAAGAEADRDAAMQSLVSLQVPAEAIKDIEAGRPVPHLEGIIRAPISGTLVEKLITPGQLLQAGTTPCFTVADLSRVWVKAQIFDADLTAVRVGDSVEIVGGVDATRFPGTVDNIGALVDPDTRSIVVRVVVRNPGDFLKKQMYVRVQIHSRQEMSALLVPVAAILRDDENLPFVYLARADDSFARQRVTLGDRTGDDYVISEGLRAGDRVVVDGGLFVQFMQAQ